VAIPAIPRIIPKVIFHKKGRSEMAKPGAGKVARREFAVKRKAGYPSTGAGFQKVLL
jgi:hypothetical protein